MLGVTIVDKIGRQITTEEQRQLGSVSKTSTSTLLYTTMATSVLLAAFSMLFSYHGCEAFVPLFLQRVGLSSDELCDVRSTHLADEDSAKNRFLESLDNQYDLNQSSDLRTQLLNDLIVDGNGLANPGSNAAFAPVASGVWRVIYAPHITTIAGLFGGEFSVQYDLREDGTMTSKCAS